MTARAGWPGSAGTPSNSRKVSNGRYASNIRYSNNSMKLITASISTTENKRISVRIVRDAINVQKYQY